MVHILNSINLELGRFRLPFVSDLVNYLIEKRKSKISTRNIPSSRFHTTYKDVLYNIVFILSHIICDIYAQKSIHFPVVFSCAQIIFKIGYPTFTYICTIN